MEGENASGCGRDSGGVGSSIRKEVVGGGGGGEVEERRREAAEGRMRTEGALCIPLKVMTDEQIEVLRQQIAIYATISEQLIQMHKTLSAQQESFTGMRLGSLYIDSLMVPGGHKLTPRQRWTPTNMHLHMLESIFKQGHGTPSKQKIKEITLELSQHGQISETNVYNWFQNRRARSKRKQAATAVPQSNAETEVGEQVQLPPNDQKFNQQINNDESFSPFMNYDMHPSDAPEHSLQTHGFYQPNYASRLSDDSGRVSYFENVLPNHRFEQFAGGMDITGSFSPFHSEGFDMMD